jgi:phosphoribosyl-ATP pyrophosphohydrolase
MSMEQGYHLTKIEKGIVGTISKIEEELNELKDAESQKSKIMIMVELSDLYGAIEEYCNTQGVSIEDLKTFSDITKRAFKNGSRK